MFWSATRESFTAGVESALVTSAAAGSHRLVEILLRVGRRVGAGAALVAAATGLHAGLIDIILEGGGQALRRQTTHCALLYATYRARERWQTNLPRHAWTYHADRDFLAAYKLVVTRLLKDPRACPAAVAEDFPDMARSWAVNWVSTLSNASRPRAPTCFAGWRCTLHA